MAPTLLCSSKQAKKKVAKDTESIRKMVSSFAEKHRFSRLPVFVIVVQKTVQYCVSDHFILE